MTSAGANTWSVPLELNNLESQISGGGGGSVVGITAGNANITITGTPTNPILSGTLVALTSNVATTNFAFSGNAPTNPSFALTGTEEFRVITSDLTPHILVSGGVSGGVQLGLPSGYGGYKVTAPTVTPSTTSDTQVATTAFVQSALPALGAGLNITLSGTANAPIVGVSAPLTSQLDVGTQDITTSVANADIDFTTTGTGRVHITQAGVSANGAMTITQTGAGGGTNPALRLVNQNATGSVATEIYKNKPTAGTASDVLHTQSVFGKDSTNAKQEYTRITHTIREATAGTEDGSIEMGCFTNGTFQNYIQMNGNDPTNGEVNILRPLDLTGNDIKTTTGSMAITTASSSGTGNLDITCKNNATLTTGGTTTLTSSGEITITNSAGSGDININTDGQIYLRDGANTILTLSSAVGATFDGNINIIGASTRKIEATGAGLTMKSAVDLNFEPEDTAGKLNFTGTALQASTSASSSGQFLIVWLNGVQYKIDLLNP
jgi:hypothetical protein